MSERGRACHKTRDIALQRVRNREIADSPRRILLGKLKSGNFPLDVIAIPLRETHYSRILAYIEKDSLKKIAKHDSI